MTTLDKLRKLDTAKYTLAELAGITGKDISTVATILKHSGLPFKRLRAKKTRKTHICPACDEPIEGGCNRRWHKTPCCQAAKKEHWKENPPQRGKRGLKYTTWDSNWCYWKQGKCKRCGRFHPVNRWSYCAYCWQKRSDITVASQEWEEVGF